MAKTMSETDKRELARLEQKIAKSEAFELEAAYALLEINQRRLYLARHNTFDMYCKSRWDMGGSAAYRLIRSAMVMNALAESDTRLKCVPSSVYQACTLHQAVSRARARICPFTAEEKLELVSVWEEAVKRSSGRVTASVIEGVVRSRRPDVFKGRPACSGGMHTGVYIGPSISTGEAAVRIAAIYTPEQIDALIGELLTISRNGLSKAA